MKLNEGKFITNISKKKKKKKEAKSRKKCDEIKYNKTKKSELKYMIL
jgi:hypothetical protein